MAACGDLDRGGMVQEVKVRAFTVGEQQVLVHGESVFDTHAGIVHTILSKTFGLGEGEATIRAGSGVIRAG
jgi:hypothetical protein